MTQSKRIAKSGKIDVKGIIILLLLILALVVVIFLIKPVADKQYNLDKEFCESKGLEVYSIRRCIKITDNEIVKHYKIIKIKEKKYLEEL